MPLTLFSDVVHLNTDRIKDPLFEGIQRFVGLEHITPEDLRVRRWGLVADGTTFTNYFKPGQVLFGKRRAYQRKVAVADFTGVCSSDIYVFESKDPNVLLPELLPFICQTEGFYEYAVSTSAGSLSPRTNWKHLAKYEFPLPPLDEQRKAVQILKSLEDVAESQRILLASCKILQLSMLENSMNTKLSKLWNKIPLTEICNIRTGKLDSNASVENGRYPFFTCDPIESKIDNYAFDCDAVLLAGNNAQGNFWVKRYSGKFNAYQRTYVLEIADEKVSTTDFVAVVLERALHELKTRSIGSTTKYLTLKILSKVLITTPPIHIQNKIIEKHFLLKQTIKKIQDRINASVELKRRVLLELSE